MANRSRALTEALQGSFSFDGEGRALGPEQVCGIDEAGRGPLAGPVVAAAAILPGGFPIGELDDSKRLSAKRREACAALIRAGALAYGIGWAYPSEIDEMNILQATMLAMRRAFESMGRGATLVLVDGNRLPGLPCPSRAIVGGDGIEPAIMAASILAKTARDRAMERWDAIYPEYGYARHKGYPTAAHREACRRLGPSPIQRMSFRYAY